MASKGASALLEKLASAETLFEAWAKVKANRGAPGADHVTIAAFEQGLGERIERLSRDLIEGSYHPAPLRMIEVPKTSGGRRPLAIPTVLDRVAQTAATLVLTPVLEPEFEDSSYGYRVGRGVETAVRRVDVLRREGYVWTVDADIERYFESVPHKKLLEQLARYVADERVVDLVERWLEAYSDTGLGLPQGGPISPLLANLYLDSVDEEIEKHGARLVRYADDFVILCKSREIAQGALERVGALLKERGLKLNPEKTRLVGYDEKLRFLGRLFVRSMMLRPTEAEEAPKEQHLAPQSAQVPLSAPADHILISQSPPASTAPPENCRGADEDKDEFGDGAPGLRVLYLMEPGRRLELRNEAFAIWEADTLAAAIPPQRVDRIEIGPAAQVNDAALRHAMIHGIPVAFVDGRGETLGWLAPPDDSRGGLHRAQAAVVLDPARRLDLAKRIVEGRLRSQRAQLRRLAPKSTDPARVGEAADKIGHAIRRLERADTIDGALGEEGAAGARYWPALGLCLKHGWQFEKRVRRPPPDGPNLAFSYLSSMLARDVAALVRRRGLHTGFGALHSVRDGFDALVADLMEEFRAPLAESVTVYLLNNRILKPEMFARNDDGSVTLWGPAAKALIRGFEAKMNATVRSPRSGHKIRWRRIIAEQIDAYAAHVEGRAPYRPYGMDY